MNHHIADTGERMTARELRRIDDSFEISAAERHAAAELDDLPAVTAGFMSALDKMQKALPEGCGRTDDEELRIAIEEYAANVKAALRKMTGE